jgi:hypothetical protein
MSGLTVRIIPDPTVTVSVPDLEAPQRNHRGSSHQHQLNEIQDHHRSAVTGNAEAPHLTGDQDPTTEIVVIRTTGIQTTGIVIDVPETEDLHQSTGNKTTAVVIAPVPNEP